MLDKCRMRKQKNNRYINAMPQFKFREIDNELNVNIRSPNAKQKASDKRNC